MLPRQKMRLVPGGGRPPRTDDPDKRDEGTGVNGENRERKSWEGMLDHLSGEPMVQFIRIQPPNPQFSLFPPVQPHVPFIMIADL